MRILFVGHVTDLSYDVDGPEAITGNSHIWDLPGHDPPRRECSREKAAPVINYPCLSGKIVPCGQHSLQMELRSGSDQVQPELVRT